MNENVDNLNIDDLKGSIVVGFSFPTPGAFELKCVHVGGAIPERFVVNSDILFLRVEKVEMVNNGPLTESEIIKVEQDRRRGAHFKFGLTNGFISVSCQEIRVRSFQT